MITGYNHNVKYKDEVYHVQTEDSGVQNPHIITHLFVGGNIIDSMKVSYADKVGGVQGTALEQIVVNLMQGQHKAMLKNLIKGQLDDKLVERSVNAAHLDGPAPLNVDRGQNVASFGFPSGAGDSAPARRPATPPPPAVAQPPVAAKPPPPAAKPPPRPPVAAPLKPPPLPLEIAPVRKPPPLPPAAPTITFAGVEMPSSFFGNAPPPDQIIEADTLERAFDSNDDSAVDSIFGEDLISEKSLDEVILSYLAEDMQK